MMAGYPERSEGSQPTDKHRDSLLGSECQGYCGSMRLPWRLHTGARIACRPVRVDMANTEDVVTSTCAAPASMTRVFARHESRAAAKPCRRGCGCRECSLRIRDATG